MFTIFRRVPSQNRSTYSHWTTYAKERDIWYALLRARLKPKDPPDCKMYVSIVSYRTRLLDYGNLVGGCKALLDGMVRLGHLKDDAPKWLECLYRQELVKKSDERTEIEIKETP